MFTLTQSLEDQGEMDKSAEHQIEFFEAGEDSAKAFEPTEQSFDFIAATIQGESKRRRFAGCFFSTFKAD